MKLRSTTPASTHFWLRVSLVAAVIVMAVTLPMQFFANRPVSADEYDEKIAALQSKIAGYQDEANALRKQANTLQNTLDQLAKDKATIQTQINLYQTQYKKVTAEIEATKQRIEENRQISGQLIVESSLSDDIPLIVRLASSENLAEYIDSEADRATVQDSIVAKTKENEALKVQLEEKQAEVKKLLEQQTFKRNELASKEAQQAQLLKETEGNESEYRKLVEKSEGQIEKLREDQRQRQLAAQQWQGGYISAGGTGGYPWAGVGYPCWTASCVDPWGLYYRECVSYVAWRLSAAGKGVRGFGGAGHAYQWPSTTSGYTTQKYGTNPKVGDAAVIPAYVQGIPWTGHIMYVEAVNGDGTISISEYNFAGDGTYSERRIPQSLYSQYTFITFPSR